MLAALLIFAVEIDSPALIKRAPSFAPLVLATVFHPPAGKPRVFACCGRRAPGKMALKGAPHPGDLAMPTVAIVGASAQRHKFGNISLRAHLQRGYMVYPINRRGGLIEGLPALTSLVDVPVARLDRISIYLPPASTLALLDEIAHKPAAEVWLNPGSADAAVLQKAQLLGLPFLHGCSIVALGMTPEEVV
jgi:hypothetical protein